MKIKEFFIRFLLIIVSVSLSLLFFDIFLKNLNLREPRLWFGWSTWKYQNTRFSLSSEYLWKLKPNTLSVMKGSQLSRGEVVYSTNSLGIRNNYLLCKKNSRNAITIALVGDSYIYGHNVSDDETISSYLETKLKKTGLNVEVLNFGVQGYSPGQEYKRLRNIILNDKSIDLVFWGISRNDLYDMQSRPMFLFIGNKLFPYTGWLNGIFLQGFFHNMFGNLFGKSILFNQLLGLLQEFDIAKYIEFLTKDGTRTKINLEKAELMINESIKTNKVVILKPVNLGATYGIPNGDTIDLSKYKNSLDLESYLTLQHENGNLKQVENYFLSEKADQDNTWNDRHPSPEGNNLMAEYIAESILEKSSPRCEITGYSLGFPTTKLTY